jgi:hypothetical protein
MVFGKKEPPEESKTITRGVPEGSGIYSCTTGDCATNPFTTTDKKEWQKHQQESKRHYLQGAAPCAVCDKEVNLSVVLTKAGNKPLHPECRGEPEEL